MSAEFSQSVWQQTKLGNWDSLKGALESKNTDLDVNFAYGPMHESLLHLVAAKGNDEIAGLLVDGGCNLNSVNRQGVTALYVAAAANAPALVELLMKSGANPNTIIPTALNTVTPGGGGVSKDWIETCRVAPVPLLVAALRGHADVVEAMVANAEVDTLSLIHI